MTKSLARYIEKVVATYLENPQTQKTVHVPNVPKDFEKFNTMIGLPVSPDKKKTIKLLPFQIDIDAAINKKRRVIINKSRKIACFKFRTKLHCNETVFQISLIRYNDSCRKQDVAGRGYIG